MQGTFGTKFEGPKVSMELSDQIEGLYHAGSVGIIMSGWLGTMNYGVITANKMDKWLYEKAKACLDQPVWLLSRHTPTVGQLELISHGDWSREKVLVCGKIRFNEPQILNDNLTSSYLDEVWVYAKIYQNSGSHLFLLFGKLLMQLCAMNIRVSPSKALLVFLITLCLRLFR